MVAFCLGLMILIKLSFPVILSPFVCLVYLLPLMFRDWVIIGTIQLTV